MADQGSAPVEISEEEKQRLHENEVKREAEHQKKVKQYLKFLDLDSCAPETKFIDVHFNVDTDKPSRTLIALGQFGLHARMIGSYSKVVRNETLALDVKQEGDYDIRVSVLRASVLSIVIQRQDAIYPEDSTPEEKMLQQPYNYLLKIHHESGDITLPALDEQSAINFKKMIYAWRIYVDAIKTGE